MTNQSKNFYQLLPAIRDFQEAMEESNFAKVPSDWFIIITDIRNSTKAIENDLYYEVNLIGVSAIVAIQNILKGIDFPFAFGGDGATLLVHEQDVENAEKALQQVSFLAASKFDLDLRVGSIRVSELEKEVGGIEISKYEIVPGKCISLLRGEGLDLAEKKIKSISSRIVKSVPSKVDLSGLSCRWEPIPSKNGVIANLIVKNARESGGYNLNIIKELGTIFPDSFENANPTHPEDMRPFTLWKNIMEERKLFQNSWSLQFVLKCLEIVYTTAIFKWNVPAIFIDAKRYKKSMRYHTDFRKFDGSLRMVLDCDQIQLKNLEALLKKHYDQGDIFYGLHVTDSALITCFVDGIEDGQHIHFIDGTKGGYAVAAKQLKEQLIRSEKKAS